jgi:4-diphosphocytidyl-2C-methyl-D-erythritol kinase
MIAGLAYAKVNLGLRVGAIREDGFHPLNGIFQSVDITDSITLAPAEVDSIATSGGGQVPDGMNNLAFRATAAVRRQAGSAQPLRISLDKTIPTAAGLGGGSADAAAALGIAARYFGVDAVTIEALAPEIGSDVPFCLRGGTARVGGRGEELEPLDHLSGFALAVVVPPFELATPAVFRRWDEMGEPAGLRIPAGCLPPALRSESELVNDLYPAAAAIEPALDDWRADLESAWGRPAMVSGSGPSLYAFFLDHDEAEDALAVAPTGARSTEACNLSTVGWTITGH